MFSFLVSFAARAAIVAWLTVVVSILPAHSADVSELPAEEELMRVLSGMLPPYWAIQDLRISGSVNRGDEVDPLIRQRFSASARPLEPLYRADPRDEGLLAPFVLIVETVNADENYTMYGVAQSTFRAGEWDTEIELESSVVDLGRVRSAFGEPALVRGSEKEQSHRREAVDRAESDARIAAELEVLKARLKGERDRIKREHESALSALEDEYQTAAAEAEARLEDLKSRFQAQIQNEREQRRQEVTRLEMEHSRAVEQALEEKRQEIEAEVAHLEAENRERMERLEQETANLDEKRRLIREDTYDLIEESIASGTLLLERFDQFLDTLPDVRKGQALRGALQSANPAVKREALRYTLNSGRVLKIAFVPEQWDPRHESYAESQLEHEVKSITISPNTSIDPATGYFEFECKPKCGRTKAKEGFMQEGALRLSLEPVNNSCRAELSLSKTGDLVGSYTCRSSGERGQVYLRL